MGPFVLLALLSALLSACATPGTTGGGIPDPLGQAEITATKRTVITVGDEADVHFTCRLRNGELALSTRQDISGELLKSSIFLPRDRSTPLTIAGGKCPSEVEGLQVMGFEGELLYRLANAILGLHTREKRTLELKAERYAEAKPGEHILKMARVRRRAKQQRFTPEEYSAKAGKNAEVGQSFIHEPAFPGEVESVSEKEVVVRYSRKEGEEIETPFGKGKIHEMSDRYEIVIDAHVGTLIRTGTFVGRIAKVDDHDITIDYSHPFGGESLLCDVEIESVRHQTKEDTSAAAKEATSEKGLGSGPKPVIAPAMRSERAEDEKTGLSAAKGDDGAVKKDDLVMVDYTAILEDGTLVYSTKSEMIKDTARKRLVLYEEAKHFERKRQGQGTLWVVKRSGW